jgi:hypothetical protein
MRKTTVLDEARARHGSSVIITIITIFMDWAMLGLFRPLEKYFGPSVLTVGAVSFVVFWGIFVKHFF